MKFYDYPDSWKSIVNHGFDKELGLRTRDDMYRWLSKINLNPLGYRHLMFDIMWNNEGRPYYDVYPSIIPMLTRLNLNFPGETIGVSGDIFTSNESSPIINNFIVMNRDEILQMNKKIADKACKLTNLLIRLPECGHILGYDDPKNGRINVRTIYLSFQPVNRTAKSKHVTLGLVVGIDIGERDATGVIPLHTMRVFPLDERPIEECIDALPIHETINEGMQIPDNIIKNCIRLVITLCLLGDNPELIEPDVLNNDKQKFLNADKELQQRLIEKAKRRGKYGFTVGAKLNSEVSPHVRIQHVALVWTGKGRKIPQIVSRKGSIVHRQKVENVPTGYQEGT